MHKCFPRIHKPNEIFKKITINGIYSCGKSISNIIKENVALLPNVPHAQTVILDRFIYSFQNAEMKTSVY